MNNTAWEGHNSGIYTFGCNFKENIVRGDSSWYASLVTGNIYVETRKSKKVLKIQEFPSSATNYNIRCVNYMISKPGRFDFTVSNPFCYEGAYLNPPYYRSLDVERNNPFLLKSDAEYMRINAPLIRYMATGIDTGAALTTTGCIKDLSGNKHHTQFNSASSNISFLPSVGTVIAPTGTATSPYGGFNTPKLTSTPIDDSGDFDEMALFVRFRFSKRSSGSSQNEACGVELTYGNSGQNVRGMNFILVSSTNKIGSNQTITALDQKGGARATLSDGHVYAGIVQYSIKQGLYREFYKDFNTNSLIYNYPLTKISTRAEGNSIVASKSGHVLNIYFASGVDIQIMESALYNQFFTDDEINWLFDNYDPSIGASAVI